MWGNITRQITHSIDQLIMHKINTKQHLQRNMTFQNIFLQVRIPAKEDTSAMGLFMFGFASVVTIVYLVNKDPFFHEAMYGVLVFALLGMDLHLNTIQYSRPGIKVFLFGFVM